MTAFARETQRGEFGELTWELRSLNHRFLESHLRLPEELRALDISVRQRIAARLRRGKVEASLRFFPAPGHGGALRLNHSLVEQLLTAGRALGTLSGQAREPAPFELLRWPGVIEEPELDTDALMSAALALLERALDSLLATRAREGAQLAGLLLERCDHLDASIAHARERVPEALLASRQRLQERMSELASALDPQRLEQELALLAARGDIDEELDRLATHVAEVRRVLARAEPIGRRLDFLMQELNREANTIGSKSSDIALTREAVEMKVLIEQMREQVQNLE